MTDPQERLDEVQQEIEEARTKAEDHGLIAEREHNQRYYEAGTEPDIEPMPDVPEDDDDEDDQNTAPG